MLSGKGIHIWTIEEAQELTRFPGLPAHVTRAQYVAANLPAMRRSVYWRRRGGEAAKWEGAGR